MTQGNPYPSAKHRTEDWDPAGKSDDEQRQIAENLIKDQPSPKPGTDEPFGPKDSDPSDMTDFEKNTTTEELKKDQPGPRLGERRPSADVEREQEPDSQSKF